MNIFINPEILLTGMSNAILVLDGSRGAEHAYERLDAVVRRDVKVVRSILETETELRENDGYYAVLLTEPFMVFHRDADTIAAYRRFLWSVRKERQIPVVLFSTQNEEVVQTDFLLRRKMHYDAYVSKMKIESPSPILRTLEALLPGH
jgi:hypothetical protein